MVRIKFVSEEKKRFNISKIYKLAFRNKGNWTDYLSFGADTIVQLTET